MDAFNPLDANQWRAELQKFDAKVAEFNLTLQQIASTPAKTPAQETVRQKLLHDAAPIKASIDSAQGALVSVRNSLKAVKDAVAEGLAWEWQNLKDGFAMLGKAAGLGVVPVIAIAISLSALAAITAAITIWLSTAKRYQLIEQGKVKETPALVRTLKTAAILAGVIIAGPWMVKELQKRF